MFKWLKELVFGEPYGMVSPTENLEPYQTANKHYWRVRVQVNGTPCHLLLTDDELERVMARARRNPEDVGF